MSRTIPCVVEEVLGGDAVYSFGEYVPENVCEEVGAECDFFDILADSAEEAVIMAIHTLSHLNRKPIHSDFIQVEETTLNLQDGVTYDPGPNAKGWEVIIGSCAAEHHERALQAWLKHAPDRIMEPTLEGAPVVGSRWRRSKPWDSSRPYVAYTVLAVTNTHHMIPAHPPTVVYRGDNGKVWSLPLFLWPGNLVPERAPYEL
jgi:hypothetical protein